MLKFHKNKSQTFKCRVEIQGVESPKVMPRLILSPNNSKSNLFFEGKYSNNQCEIEISSPNVANKGSVVLEIIANDTVFRPWKSTYEIVSDEIVVENVELVDTKNNISVKLVETVKETVADDRYVNFLKRIPEKKRKKFLEYIKNSYRPKGALLEWSKKEFNENKSLKAKVAMYYRQNEFKLIKEDIKSKFPEIEEWDRNKKFSDLLWKVTSKKKWDEKKAGEFQSQAGYDPAGYGGPYEFNQKKNIDGTFTITWKSGATS